MALVEGTSALAVGAVGAWMTSTGVPLTVIQGGKAAAETAISKAIAGYAVSNAIPVEGVNSAIVAGVSISTTGKILIAAAAVAVIAAVVIYLINSNDVQIGDETPKNIVKENKFTGRINGSKWDLPGLLSTSGQTDMYYWDKSGVLGNQIKYTPGFVGSYPNIPFVIDIPWGIWDDLEIDEEYPLYTFDDTGAVFYMVKYGLSGGSYELRFRAKMPNTSYVQECEPYGSNHTKSIYHYRSEDGEKISRVYFAVFRRSLNDATPVIVPAAYTTDKTGKVVFDGLGLINQYGDVFTTTRNQFTFISTFYLPINEEEYDVGVSIPEYDRYVKPEVEPGKEAIITLPDTVPAPDLGTLGDIVTEGIADNLLTPETVPAPEIENVLNPAPNPNPEPLPVPVPLPYPVPPTEPVPPPTLPTIGGVDCGMIRLWNPNVSEMSGVVDFMLNGDFIDNVIKLFANPADYILSLSVQPVVPTVGAKEQPYIGSLPVPGVTMSPITSQYATIECGSVTVPETFGNFLDYSTEASIFVPFVGEVPLNIDDVIGSTLTLSYRVDLLTGTCTAMLRVQRAGTVNLDAILYQWPGNMAAQIPIRASSWNVTATDIAAGALSGAAAGPVGALVGGASALAMGMLRPRVTGSGSLSGNAGHLGVQTPFLIFTRPKVATPSTYRNFIGSETSAVNTLSELSGYTAITSIVLDGIPATSSELSEIETLLKGGVFL